MTNVSRFVPALLLVLATPAVAVHAQPGSGPAAITGAEVEQRAQTAAGFPLAQASSVEDAPLVDGDVLNDPA